MDEHKEIIIGGSYDYQAQEKSMELAKLINEGIVVELLASIFFRQPKRKEKEPFEAYRRGLRNQKKASKAYFRFGPNATVLINKETMVVI